MHVDAFGPAKTPDQGGKECFGIMEKQEVIGNPGSDQTEVSVMPEINKYFCQ
jgi:hypothetical protein